MNIPVELNPNSILDIGANIGDFAAKCKLLWPNSFVYCIEANEHCEKYLNLKCDKYLISLLGDENKESVYYTNKLNMICQGNSIYKEINHKDQIQISKKMVRLDSIFKNEEKFDLIKIDTQGSELKIISGGINLIKKSKYIILELSILQYNESSPLYNEVINKMLEYNFCPEKILNKCYINNKLTQIDLLFFNISN